MNLYGVLLDTLERAEDAPSKMGKVGPVDTTEGLLAETLLETTDCPIEESVLPLDVVEVLDEVWVSSIMMTSAQLDMMWVSFEMAAASVQTASVATHQIT